jgi:hypothetical protein
MTNLDPEDQGKHEWVYELYASAENDGAEHCPSQITGTLGDGNAVSFTAPGLKKGLPGCQFRIKTVEGAFPPGVKPLADTEPGTLYWAKDLLISQNASGALEATAALQKLFVVEPSPDARHGFTLTVPVKFAVPETRPAITASLNCKPGTGAIGVLPADPAAATEFTFYIAIDRAVPFQCTDLSVAVDGHNNVYTGVFSGTSGEFTAEPDKALRLADTIALKLMGDAPTDDDGVHVNVDPADCTADGKIYDRLTKKCIDKPAATAAPTATPHP